MSLTMSHPTNRIPGSIETRNSSTEPSEGNEPELFSRRELREFAAEDAQAGRAIGKILVTLFIYTIVAMTIVIIWTYRTVGF